MFGKRITLAASASLVGASFLLAQSPPDRSTQGTALPGQQQPGTPSAAPISPAAPTAAPTVPAAPTGQIPAAPRQTQNPSQPQGEKLPGQATPASRDIPSAPTQPGQEVPTQVQPGTTQPQPRSNDKSQQAGDQSQRPMSDDAKFVVKAAEIDLAEINIGRLAAQRASRPEVRQFANKLVQDHSTNLTQLNQMANRNNWKNGERMDQEHLQLFQKLAALQGPKFDQEFIQNMVEGHKKAAEVFKHASENCKSAEIKQFATQTLATIRQHEQEAQRLNGQNQNQGPTTQPTSSNDDNATRTDGNRNNNTPPNNDKYRRDDR